MSKDKTGDTEAHRMYFGALNCLFFVVLKPDNTGLCGFADQLRIFQYCRKYEDYSSNLSIGIKFYYFCSEKIYSSNFGIRDDFNYIKTKNVE